MKLKDAYSLEKIMLEMIVLRNSFHLHIINSMTLLYLTLFARLIATMAIILEHYIISRRYILKIYSWKLQYFENIRKVMSWWCYRPKIHVCRRQIDVIRMETLIKLAVDFFFDFSFDKLWKDDCQIRVYNCMDIWNF